MAVTAPVSLSKVRAEFGGASPPANLKSYPRNSAYVPDSAANAAISTDPNALRLSTYEGAVKTVAPVVAMPDLSPYVQGQSGTIVATVSIGENGSYSADGIGSGTWLTAGSSSDVEMYISVTGGSGGSWAGTFNTWVTGGIWVSLSRSTNGNTYGTANITFRNKTTQATLDSAVFDFHIYRGIPV